MQNIKAVIVLTEKSIIAIVEGKIEIGFPFILSDIKGVQPIQAIFIDESAEVKEGKIGDVFYNTVAGNIWEIKDSHDLNLLIYGNRTNCKHIVCAYPSIPSLPLPSPSFMAEFAAKNGIGEIVCEMVKHCSVCHGTDMNLCESPCYGAPVYYTYATIDGCIDLRWKDDKGHFNKLQSAAINAGKIFNAEDDLKVSPSLEERAKEAIVKLGWNLDGVIANDAIQAWIDGFPAATTQSDKGIIDFAVWKDKHYARVMDDERYYDTRLAHSSFYTIPQLLAIYKSK